ncbi:LacI family DNA-binding transcriptional regulator [Rosenbergiella australiborealis]|uniref:LacI family DNA-binding transcriptional regulator n=1 Tax=Rosenbergiella australiborealis TaxID=1544696 RepID=UPI001F4D57F7|nr:LacI family DNA-binding transcriptional regulator [Rosenbergiella australiborealis]
MSTKSTRATISDVAKAANTGKTSVSRYLNGEHQLLSDDLKHRIKQAISDLNYSPSQMARSLKHGRTKLIGLLIADITNPYSIEVMGGVETACRDNGFTLLMCNTNNKPHLEQHYLQLLSSYQVEGIIVNAANMQESAFDCIQHTQIPLTLIDRKVSNYDYDVVGLDNFQGSVDITQHLIDNHYRSLLFISEPLAQVNTRKERLEGFLSVVTPHDEITAEHAEVSLDNSELLHHIIATFIDRNRHQPAAIITANGTLMLLVTKVLHAIKLVWGQDIGLASFDEMNWSSIAGCGITTLQQPTQQIGYSAFQNILTRLKHFENPAQETRFEGRLIVRPSSQALINKN